jgi:DNA polymerase III subunit beta
MTKTHIETAQFATELEWVSRFAHHKSTIPILANVLLETGSDGHMRLIATDLETAGMSRFLNVGIDAEAWRYTVPAKLLLKYLKKIDESHIALYLENDELIIEHGDSKVSFAGMSAESFPELPTVEISAEISGLQSALPRTMLAVSKEANRFTLNGALLDAEASALVSTDGHRLSFMPVTITGKIDRTLIPTRALVEAERLLGKFGTSLGFGRDENHVAIINGHRAILARVLTGNFPDYKRVLPKEFDHSVSLDRTALFKAINRLDVLAPNNKLITFHVNGSLELATQGEQSKGSAKVPIVSSETGLDWGKGVGFNASYLQDFAKEAAAIDVSFHFSEPTRGEKENHDGSKTETLGWKAAEWRTLDGWRYVVMPMRAA